MCLGPDAHVRGHIVMHQLLHTVRGNDRHLLPAVLLRTETRAEHPGRHPAADHDNHDRDDDVRHVDGRPPPHVAVPRKRPQGSHNGGRNNGHIPVVLGAVLLCEHNRGVLQDMHTRSRVQGAHVARLFQLRVQSDYLFHIQHGIPGRVPPHTDHPLSGLVLLQRLPDRGSQFGHFSAAAPPEANRRWMRLRVVRLGHGRGHRVRAGQTERKIRGGGGATGRYAGRMHRPAGHEFQIVDSLVAPIADQLV